MARLKWRADLSEEQYKRAILSIFILALFVQILDTTIVNVAIPTLADEFDVSDTQIEGTISGYLVGLAVFIPTSGWLASRFGSRPVFLGALILFTVASALAGQSQTLFQLIGFRILQGVGSGILGPVGAALLFSAYPQSERAKATTAVISVAVLAPASGPVLGGLILETLGWRWIFYVNLPIGLLALVAAAVVLRDSKAETAPPFDLVGFLLAGVGLGSTLFGISIARNLGWTSPTVIVALVAGISAATVLPLVERRRAHPILRFDLFKDPIFRSIQVVAVATYAGFMGVIFLMPVYLQSLRGFSPLQTGLTTFPQALGIWLATQLVGRVLYIRIGPRRLLYGGLASALAIGLLLAMVDLSTSLWTIRVLMFTRGFGMGFAFVAIQTAVYAQTSLEDTAQATTIFTATRHSAPALGVSMAAAVLASRVEAGTEPLLGDFRVAFFVTAMLFVPALFAVRWVRDEDAAATLGPKSTAPDSAARNV